MFGIGFKMFFPHDGDRDPIYVPAASEAKESITLLGLDCSWTIVHCPRVPVDEDTPCAQNLFCGSILTDPFVTVCKNCKLMYHDECIANKNICRCNDVAAMKKE